MRVGVTGSSGFIGAALVAALEERGDHVTRFVRPESPRRGDSVVRWEPSRQSLDPGDLAKAGGFDAAINLAGAGIADRRWSEERKEQLVRSRIESTTLLVEALRSLPSGVPMLASGSAIGYYGTRGDERLDESSSSGGDFLATLCVGWEQAATPLSQQGSTVALVRTGIVLDRRGGALKKQLPLFRLGLGGRLSSGHQWLSPISLVDEVRALLWAIDRRVAGPVNFVCPTPLNNKEFTKNLASALHRRALVPVPAVALEAALGRQLAIEAVLASQRVVPRVLSESGFTFKHGNGSSIIEAALQP